MIILSKIFGNTSFNSTINFIRLKNSNSKLFNSKLFKSKLLTNSKLFAIFLASAVITTALLTTNAWAYKVGDFPGVGSYAKWQEAWGVERKIFKINNNTDQIDLCRSAIAIYPYEADFWINLGNLYTDKNKKIECYLQAAKLNPDDCGGYQGAAYEYQQMGQYEKAIVYWKKAIAVKSNDSGSYVSLATCLEAENETQEAINLLLEGYKLTSNIDILYDIGVGYYKLHNYDMAKSYFNKCLKIRPNYKRYIDSLNLVNKELNKKGGL